MADVKAVKLPEDVANDFKYVGNGAAKYIVPGVGTINVETITPAQAAAIVSRVHFLQKKAKRKPKADQT